MKKQSKKLKVSIKRFLCVSILIFGIITFSSVRLNATTVSYDPPSYSSLIPHDPISITSDSGLELFPGSGTAEDPYLIEGYNITTTSQNGIYITDTTKYFIVRNCYVEADDYGIYINGVSDGTATIINNTCNNHDYHGIYLRYSGSSTVGNNTCNNNNYGIRLYNSGSSTVGNNTCNDNNNDGIDVIYSGSSTITNNTCNNNNYGVYLYTSGSSTVVNNTCNNNLYGIYPHYSTDVCVVTYNLLQENGAYGVFLGFGSDNNLIHHNTFVENYLLGTSQAKDDGSNNFWYDTVALEGNYWSDWSGTGTYSIAGLAGSEDLYPIDEPVIDVVPPLIVDIIHSPSAPTELDIIVINATVTDASGVQSVTLHYRVNGGSWLTISMTFLIDNIYSAITGSFAVSDTIEYYISAVDDSINFNEAIEDNNGQYYDLFVGSSDFTSPTIENIAHSPSSPTEIDTITVNATITDTSGIYNVTLHYRVNGGIWQNINMSLLGGDVYSIGFGPFAVSDTIEYYISTVDDSINLNEAIEDNDGLYYVLTVGYSDVTGPTIENIAHSPSSPTEIDIITVNATITDTSGIYNVTLHYRVNGGIWQNISMTLVNDDIYSAILDPFSISDTIEYYFTAIDNYILKNEATEDNSGQYYDIFVGSSDTSGPSIIGVVHSPSSPTELETVTVNATVTDDSGLQSITLHYRVNGGAWQTIEMTLIDGDLYSVTIGPFAVSDTIEYYISAVDNSINYNLAIDANAGLYYAFTVAEVIPEFQMISLLLPAITCLFLGFGLVVLQRRKR